MERQIVLDTETTGIDPKEHRIIEIGCVELINRELTGRHFHHYINPEREVEAEAFAVHGISNEMLADKPVFASIVQDFIDFVQGAELIIHNAPFDVGHINAEFARLAQSSNAYKLQLETVCTVFDTLPFARQKHPGQRNSLDALCKRYGIDNSQRELHGALLDSEILADVYLAMTGGQMELRFQLEETESNDINAGFSTKTLDTSAMKLQVIRATQQELEAHEALLDQLEKSAGKRLWH